MKVKSTVLLLIGGLSLAPMPMLAHHSFMAEFDQKQPVTMSGVVTAVKWQNPHTFFYVDVTDGNGKTVNWALETGSPNALLMRGWTRETMKQGDHVLVRGYRAKDGANLAAARSVTLADGRTVFGGQMDDGGPTR
jgi:hypothetical protein